MSSENPSTATAAGPDLLVIGLTGPIGCGKSTVAAMLGELGAAVIDADYLARQATEPGSPTLPAIRERFGAGVFLADGVLDRARLAEIVFDDPRALADLEAIVHPVVRRLVETELANAVRLEAPFAVVEAIKLIEGGLADRCNEVWLIDCTPATQRRRLEERGMQPDDAARRVAAQGPQLADRLADHLAERAGAPAGGLRPGPRLRRLATDGSLAETRDLVENALADALALNG